MEKLIHRELAKKLEESSRKIREKSNMNLVLKNFAKYMKIWDMVFTGHMHGNDISKYSLNNSDLYDIETGSLLTYPSPIKIINVDRENNEKTIS